MKSRKKGLFMQAGIFAGAGIIVRIIGLLYRSPLTAIIGDEGNGYYSYAYNCYSIALLISSYSIPSAISKIIAGKLALGQYENAQRFFRCALWYVCVVGGLVSLALLIFAPAFVTDVNAVPVLRVFAPTVFLFGILGVLRGFFQAHKTMVQTSISQILEQIGNAVISILAALILTGIASSRSQTTRAVYGAVGSAIGTGAGVIIALLFMLTLYSANRQYVHDRIFLDMHRPQPMESILRKLVSYVTPFILSTFVYNMTTLLDQTIYTRVMIGVKAVESSIVATDYGVFSGKAVVITGIPIAIASAISAAMIPDISGLYAKKKRKDARRLCGQVIRMTMLIAIPSAIGLIVLARPVTLLLFPQRATLAKASYLLALLSVTVVLYSLSTLTNAILQGVGRVWTPAINSLIAICVQGFLLFLLLRFTGLGSYALVIALIVHATMTCLLNQRSINRYRLARIDYRQIYLAPLIASAVMGLAAFVTYLILSLLLGLVIPGDYFVNFLSLVPALLVAVYVYAAALLRTGVVSKEELLRFPKGKTLYRIAKRTGIYPTTNKSAARAGAKRRGSAYRASGAPSRSSSGRGSSSGGARRRSSAASSRAKSKPKRQVRNTSYDRTPGFESVRPQKTSRRAARRRRNGF